MTARKWRSPALLLALLLVLALASLGLGYGLWSKTLTIDGTVNTGTVHAKWTAAVTTDPPGSPDLKDESGARYDKDVGMLECTIDDIDPEILHYTIHDGYPSYYADCEVEWTNDGTIPVDVADLRAGPEGGPLVSIPFDEWVDLDLDDDGLNDINLKVVNGLLVQIDPGKKDAYSVWVHVKQDAPQDAVLGFDIEVQLNQWNEQ